MLLIVPPLIVNGPVPRAEFVASVPAALMFSVPAESVTPPAKVLLPLRVNAEVVLFCVTPVTFGPITALIVVAPAPAPAFVRAAGAILLGKTTSPEFGWKGVTDSPLTGISRSPWNVAMTPGGSSGGSAAAVAGGMAHCAIGTDAGGSVRIPASFCGLFGLKATRGRIAAYPPSVVWTLGHIGPIARSVSDIALLLNVIGQPDMRDWAALPLDSTDYLAALATPLPKLRVAYSRDLGHAQVNGEVASAVERVAVRLRDLGVEVVEVRAPLPDARVAFRTIFEAALSHGTRLLDAAGRERLDPGLARLLKRADAISRTEYLEAYDFQLRLTREARMFHREFDFLLTPTLAVPPFEAGVLSPPGYDPENWLDWSPFTPPFNLTGQPALTLPCGLTRSGLPIGAQLVGPLYSDAALLRLAYALEHTGLCTLPGAQCLAD